MNNQIEIGELRAFKYRYIKNTQFNRVSLLLISV